jgi:hypothetical protein
MRRHDCVVFISELTAARRVCWAKELEYTEMPQDDDISIEDLLTTRQCHSAQTLATSVSTAAGSQVGVKRWKTPLNHLSRLESITSNI